jgi:phosphoglycerate dehydrogenase-like enzyme
LLKGQVVSIYGFGSIAKKLVEMLKPFHMTIRAAKRTPSAYPGVTLMTPAELDNYLGDADHVINILPANADSEGFFGVDRFRKMKKNAFYYNIGRGTTTDQFALRTVLETNHIGGAYLDVTTPEPFPKDEQLWRIPNCYITPHTAGGHHDEFDRLMRHFVHNLNAYTSQQMMIDRIV